MDSFELNKIMGAVLGTLMFVMGVGFLAEAIYHPIEDRGPGYALPEPEVAEAGGAEEAAPEVPLGVLLASASADRGAAAVRKCQSCHSFGEGEAAKQGPNLYHIVGASAAHMDGFAYSDALLEHKAAGDTWTYENLNAFLTNPKAYAPGTKMTFAGLSSGEDRANVIAYLKQQGGGPDYPAPAAAAAGAAKSDAAAAGTANANAGPGPSGTPTNGPEGAGAAAQSQPVAGKASDSNTGGDSQAH